jgi:hypothetical protein
MRLSLSVLAAVVLITCSVLSPAVADWSPDNPDDMARVKMHFPQLPDPFGWDIEILSYSHECADDWLCTESGWVTDIHFWISWQNDSVSFDQIEYIVVTIYDNDTTGPFSKPGEPLWGWAFVPEDWTMIEYGTGLQGFADPQHEDNWQQYWIPAEHRRFQQINIEDIDLITGDPFYQEAGKIYWLGIFVSWSTLWEPVGWKTADVGQYPEPYTGRHYMDDAVYRDLDMFWQELIDPFTGLSLDFAFVITGECYPSETQSESWGRIKSMYR